MIDLVFKNWTSQKSLGEKFFLKILKKASEILKLNKKLEISVNLVGEAKIKSLNKKYTNKDKPTDVLSFPLGDGGGDIFICLSIAKKQAKSENTTIEKKLAQLVVHAFLHLQNYDHETDKQEKEMTGLEQTILDSLNI